MTKVVRRGFETDAGEAGLCEACGVDMPRGPDACLGYLPGVFAACCGHGSASAVSYWGPGLDPRSAYVAFEEGYHPNNVVLRGKDAITYFRSLGKGPP